MSLPAKILFAATCASSRAKATPSRPWKKKAPNVGLYLSEQGLKCTVVEFLQLAYQVFDRKGTIGGLLTEELPRL